MTFKSPYIGVYTCYSSHWSMQETITNLPHSKSCETPSYSGTKKVYILYFTNFRSSTLLGQVSKLSPLVGYAFLVVLRIWCSFWKCWFWTILF